ncbi:MAG: hypothetical protein ACYCY9_11795 [Thiobacillus sp.]
MLNRILGSIGSLIGQDAKRPQGVKRHTPQTVPAAKQGKPGNYHCVEVRGGASACEAVKRLGGSRYLPDEAPSLPIPGCNAQNCTCGYFHHADRREDDRRNAYRLWAFEMSDNQGERRASKDRRTSAGKAFKSTMAF